MEYPVAVALAENVDRLPTGAGLVVEVEAGTTRHATVTVARVR